ncbi:hypothetical protein WA026_003875 [Henosepilachna vigintioctopunctata]|uniref:Fatty acyl-CoA reductase n=1 Tax=Henosepilachna vigintioctopunctata TaxID=420089 RepID=A0AAW1UDL0_9CUCU
MSGRNRDDNFIGMDTSKSVVKSNIAEYFDGKTVFLTGATGFLGKLILEKILRACKSVKAVYILVRSKKGVHIDERIEALFAGPAMDRLKKENPKFRQQVEIIPGDLLLPHLGMSEGSIRKFKENVNIVIHCGASVRFDQMIREATYANVRSVKHLIEFSKEARGLQSFLYISTAYSHCPQELIKEEFYQPPIQHNALIQLVDILDRETLEKITPILLGEWPNTYSYTKAVAESLIQLEGGCLPIAIVRPSIIIGAVNEPIPGWIDSIYGPTGLFLLGSLGIVRTAYGNRHQKKSYNEANNRNSGTNSVSEEMIPIYNYCYSPNLPVLTWDKMLRAMYNAGYESFATTRILWFPGGSMKTNKYYHEFAKFFNMMPAYIADFYFKITGKEQMAVDKMKRVFAALDVIGYFTRRNWKFDINNTQKLFKSLNSEDQRLFEFDMDTFHLETYISEYLKCIRVYILKDPMDTIRAGQWHGQKLRAIYFLYWGLIYGYLLYWLKRLIVPRLPNLKSKISIKLFQ